MKKNLETARIATEAAQLEIGKVRDQFKFPQPEYSIADDAHLGVSLAITRIKELEKILFPTNPTP